MKALTEYYKTQLRLYEKMFGVSLEQEKAIREKDYKKLFLLIKEKEKLIREIDRIKEKPSSFFAPRDKEEGAVVKEIAKLLKRILVQEKKNESLLKDAMQKVSFDLKQISKAENLQKAYRGVSRKPHARFLDQRK